MSRTFDISANAVSSNPSGTRSFHTIASENLIVSMHVRASCHRSVNDSNSSPACWTVRYRTTPLINNGTNDVNLARVFSLKTEKITLPRFWSWLGHVSCLGISTRDNAQESNRRLHSRVIERIRRFLRTREKLVAAINHPQHSYHTCIYLGFANTSQNGREGLVATTQPTRPVR